jgi:hypothetical protein
LAPERAQQKATQRVNRKNAARFRSLDQRQPTITANFYTDSRARRSPPVQAKATAARSIITGLTGEASVTNAPSSESNEQDETRAGSIGSRLRVRRALMSPSLDEPSSEEVMPQQQTPTQHGFIPRTHIRVVREDGREFPNMFVAYRELLGTPHELGYSEHQRMRASIRSGLSPRDSHGFKWTRIGAAVAEALSIAWTDFTFGVELELLAPFSMYDMKERLARIGINDWRVVHDGSLHGAPGFTPMEVVTGILQGQDGLDKLNAALQMIKAVGCKVNTSCGMHVHIGVRGMKPERVRRIAIAFLNAEQHFDAVVPASRRSNRFCQSNVNRLGLHDRERLAAATSISGIAHAMNGGTDSAHYNPHRYYKLNFQSFVHHGTIEFRQHSGTVEASKAIQWVRMIAGFCARSAAADQQTLGSGESFEQFMAAVTDEGGQRFFRERSAYFAARERAAA